MQKIDLQESLSKENLFSYILETLTPPTFYVQIAWDTHGLLTIHLCRNKAIRKGLSCLSRYFTSKYQLQYDT